MARQIKSRIWFIAVLLPLVFFCPPARAVEIAKAPRYSVVELTFEGPVQSPKDVPARDIDFWARFRHESGSPEYKIHGFWDGGDPTPYLKYIAARYGSYPNVWICLCNEFDIKEPKYTEQQIARFGQIIRQFLPYSTPLSVHTVPRTLWPGKFDDLGDWNDHQIIQKKIRNLPDAADAIQYTWLNPEGKGPHNKPTINDELSYEGKGDKHTEHDTIESHLGAFLGGGYGTTGEKPGSKLGQYFKGCFNPAEHTSADNLKYLREIIDKNVTFWKMSPETGIFSNLHPGFRGMAWASHEYVLGTNKAHKQIVANLPEGTWTIKRYDIISKEQKTLSETARGSFTFDAPDSRAVIFHFKKN